MSRPVPAQFHWLFPESSDTSPMPAWIQRGDQTFRLVVTGSRHWPVRDAVIVHQALSAILAALHRTMAVVGAFPNLVVVDGKCPYGGVDQYASTWATQPSSRWLGVTNERCEPRIVNGRVRGPERNERMVAAGADMGLAFPMPGSRGTIDCIHRLVEHQVPIWLINYEPGFVQAFHSGGVVI